MAQQATAPTGSTPIGNPDARPSTILDIIRQNQKQMPGGKMVPVNPWKWKRTFWEDPQRVVRYRNYVHSLPPGKTAPAGIPSKEIEQAYQYLKFRNEQVQGKPVPWTEWAMLPESDPGTSWLRNIAAPPEDVVLPDIQNYKVPAAARPPAVEPFGDWDKLQPWQQVYLGIFSPQPGLTGRPEWTRASAAIGQGMLAVPGGAAVGSILGGPVGAAVGGGLAAAGTAYQLYTGNQVPVLNELLTVFNLLPEGAMRVLGVGSQALQEGLPEIMADLPNAWKAADVTYITAKADLINVMASLAGDDPAKLDEVWQIAKGVSEPVKLEGSQTTDEFGITRGAMAQREARIRIGRGEDPMLVYQEMLERFGDTGSFNEFMLQTLLDPTPWAMWGVQKGGGKILQKIPGIDKRLGYAIESGAGDPWINALPIGLQQLASWITGKPGTEGLIASVEKYRNWVVRNSMRTDVNSVPAVQLSDFEKWAGGLTEEGKIAEVQPGQVEGPKGVRGWLAKLNSLTDEAKSEVFLSMTQDNLNRLVSEAATDPALMVQLLHQAGSVNPAAAGQIGKAILDSPVTATISQAVRDVLGEGWADTMLARWNESAEKRMVLVKISDALGKKPQDVLQAYTDNPDALMREISNLSNIPGDPSFLRSVLDVFTEENHVPLTPDAFRYELMTTFFDKMDGWIVKRYGLKPDSAVLRLSQTLKSMQSLLLLGLNPSYFINNAVNNIATRAAVGVFGYMTPDQIKGYLERFGTTPARISEAVTPEGTVINQGRQINQAKQAGDWIDNLHSVVNATNRKLGLFSRFSSQNEQMEGANAYVIGMKRFWGTYWKRESGFQRMHPALEATLDRMAPGVKEAVYRVVEAGMNMREIEKGLYGEVIQPQLAGIIEDAAKAVEPQNPQGLIGLLRDTGVEERLLRDLATAKTADDVAGVIQGVQRELQAMLDEKNSQELVHRAEEITERVRAEGFPAALELFNELHTRIGIRWLKHFQDLQALFDKRGEMDKADFDAAIRAQDEADSQEWARLNEYELQTYAGILRALKMEGESSKQFVGLLAEQHANWRMFFDGWDETMKDGGTVHHQGRRELYRDFFKNYKRQKNEKWADFVRRSGPAWKDLQNRLADMYNRHAQMENDLSTKANDLFAKAWAEHTGQPDTAARAWRKTVMDIRKQMQARMMEFRRMVEQTAISAEDRRVLWNNFLKEYNGLVVRLKTAEIEGASALSGQPEAAKTGAEAMKAAEAAAQPKPAPQTAEAAGETTVNAALAAAEGKPVEPNAQVVDLMGLAKKYGVVTKSGEPIGNYFINIVNKILPEGQEKYTTKNIDQVPLSLAERALKAHLDRHQGERAAEMAKLRLAVDAILHEADTKKREALIKSQGLMGRRLVAEKMKSAFKAKEAEVRAVMALMDQHADEMARREGKTPSDATRDAWYAAHIDAILRGDELEQAGQVGITNYSSMSEDPVNAAMHAAMEMHKAGNPDALKILRWGVEQGVAHLHDILGPKAEGLDFTFGKFGGEEEPTIYFRTDIGDAELGSTLYALSRVGDESFHQWAVLVSREAQPDAQYGPVEVDGIKGVVEPYLEVRFGHELAAEDYMIIDGLTNELGIGGYTIMPDGMGIEIMRVSMYNGDTPPVDFANTLSTLSDRLAEAGMDGKPSLSAREVYLVNQDTNDPAIGAYSYSELEGMVRVAHPEAVADVDDRLAQHPYQPQQPPDEIAALLPAPELAQITVEQARRLAIPLKLPDNPYFYDAVDQTPGAQITTEGLVIDLTRYQKSEQAGKPSVRTGVFYLARGGEDAETYKGLRTDAYGGPRNFTGKTLIRSPLVVEGYSGGRVPELAYQQMRGRNAFAKLHEGLYEIASPHWGPPGQNRFANVNEIRAFLKRFGGDPTMAEYIFENSLDANQLFFALQEHIVANWARRRGYDAVLGISAEEGITEVFDVREIDYPSRKRESRVHPSIKRSSYPYEAAPLFDETSLAQQGGQAARAVVEKLIQRYGSGSELRKGASFVTMDGRVITLSGMHDEAAQRIGFSNSQELIVATGLMRAHAEGGIRPTYVFELDYTPTSEQALHILKANRERRVTISLIGQNRYAVFERGDNAGLNDWLAGVSRQADEFYQTAQQPAQGNKYQRMVQEVRDRGQVDYATAAALFEGGTPEYLNNIVRFVMEQRQKYTTGKMTTRDVAKAYLLTVSSQGSGEIKMGTALEAFRAAGIEFTRDGEPLDLTPYVVRINGEDYIRPEDITGVWLLTDQGKRALDALEQTGEITPEWAQFLRARHVFGRFGNEPDVANPGDWWLTPGARYKRGKKGQHLAGSKYNLADIKEITRQFNEAGGDPEKVGAVLRQLAGIGEGKVGFVKHLLGFGDEMTLDTQEANFWKERVPAPYRSAFDWGNWAHAEKEMKGMITDAFAKLRQDPFKVGADIPEEVFNHIMHHWLWDLRKKQTNRHIGMYVGQQLGQEINPPVYGKLSKTAKAATRFRVEDGRAVIRALNAPDITSMVHEVGHIFRRDLSGRDLDVVAKLGGLKDGAELQHLQDLFDRGELQNDPALRQRYVDTEEAFARGWERYLAEGDAPTPALRSLFQRFTDWMIKIYKSLKRDAGKVIGFDQQPDFKIGGETVRLDAEIDGVKLRDIFDRLLVEQADRAEQPQLFQRADWVQALIKLHGTANEFPRNSSFLTKDGKIVPVDTHIASGYAVAHTDIRTFLRETGLARVHQWAPGLFYFEIKSEPTMEQAAQITRVAKKGTVVVEIGEGKQVRVKEFAKGNTEALNDFLAGETGGTELLQAGTSLRTVFDKGGAVHPDDLDLAAIQAADPLPVPDNVKTARKAALEGLTGKERSYASALVKWLDSYMEGDEPETTLPVRVAFRVREQVMRQSAILGDWAGESRLAHPLGKVPETGLVALRVHAFQHGGENIVAAIYLNNEPVAYVPEGMVTVPQFDTIDGPARLLGLDPNVPRNWVAERNGSITSFDPDDVGRDSSLYQESQRPAEQPVETELHPWLKNLIEMGEVSTRLHKGSSYLLPDGRLVWADSDHDVMAVAASRKAGERAVGIGAFARTTGAVRMGLYGNQMYIMTYQPLTPRQMNTVLANLDSHEVVVEIHSRVLNWDTQEFAPGQTGEVRDFLTSSWERNVLYQNEGEPAQPVGEVPPGGTPASEPFADTLDEAVSERIRPMLNSIRDRYQAALADQPLKFTQLDADAQGQVKGWLKGVRNDMASMKYATMGYGEQMRDASLLNYNRRYGFDQYMEIGMPYEFWYTRTMINWAKRMIDRPSWFGMYARLQEMQERQRHNMPTRLQGKMRMAAPWLPEWAGGGLWFDPSAKLFPPATFGQPMLRAFQSQNQATKRAESLLKDMAEAGKIGQGDYQAALETHDGPAWQDALAQAQVEMDQDANPANLVGMMMSPSLWWTAGSNLLNGKPEKMSVLPITRTARAAQTALQGSPLEALGNVAGWAALPEEKLRGAAGLSQFGEWGKWYIDRQLSNMAADGAATPEEARIAMVERQGPVYDQAVQRVRYEEMLSVPGMATMGQLAGGNVGGAIESLPNMIFPGTLFPEGELKLRGLYDDYGKAWDDYRAGNDDALNTFFTEHPEYEARLALYDQPEERLHKFLINEVWDRYSSLDKPNRTKATQALGKRFREAFLSSDTRNYDAIDDEELARWSQMLGGAVPKTEQTTSVLEAPSGQIEMYSPELVTGITTYQQERNQRYPGITAIQAQYYNYPQGSAQRRQMLGQFPQLKQYWSWNRAYKAKHPELDEYWNRDTTGGGDATTMSEQEFSTLDPVLLRQVLAWGLSGQSLSSGARAYLRSRGQSRGLSDEEYARMVLANLVPTQ